jgi:hypothetical protein
MVKQLQTKIDACLNAKLVAFCTAKASSVAWIGRIIVNGEVYKLRCSGALYESYA